MRHFDHNVERQPTPLESNRPIPYRGPRASERAVESEATPKRQTTPPRSSRIVTDSQGSPTRVNSSARSVTPNTAEATDPNTTPPAGSPDGSADGEADYDDHKASEVTQGRLVQGRIVEDDYPSPDRSVVDGSVEDDPMTMSHASSFFVPEPQSLGGSGDAAASSDEEDNAFEDPGAEHLITLVGNVKNRTVFIVDDMIDKAGSWIAAAETVVKKGGAKRVY